MRYYVKKIVSLIMVLFLIMLLTFLAFQVIPWDGAISRLGIHTVSGIQTPRHCFPVAS